MDPAQQADLVAERDALREELERTQRERDLTLGVAKATTDRLREERDALMAEVTEWTDLEVDLVAVFRERNALRRERDAFRGELESTNGWLRDERENVALLVAENTRLREALERTTTIAERMTQGSFASDATKLADLARAALEPKEDYEIPEAVHDPHADDDLGTPG